jgi:hypothetical protein
MSLTEKRIFLVMSYELLFQEGIFKNRIEYILFKYIKLKPEVKEHFEF